MKIYKIYKGHRSHSVVVHPDTGHPYALPWRLDLWNHSPTGLNWGYGGSGPAQCALALLADHLDDDREVMRLHQPFKWAVIAKLPIDEPWELTSEQIDNALAKLLTRWKGGRMSGQDLPF